jgi:hypothetical protein
MNWARPSDLRAQLQRMWDRGELLASLVTGEKLFPKRLALKCPTSAEIAERFAEVRVWIGELREMSHCRVEMRELTHRVFGANAVPQEAWIDSIEDALALIDKQRDVAHFTALTDVTRKRQPQLLSWLARRPMRALELVDEWSLLLEIVAWLQAHSRPGVYLRQVDIPGVHSKFIEAHRGVLAELLDIVLPSEVIDPTASRVSQFARRYGFCDKPVRVRFRVLDPGHALLPGDLIQDITLDAESFARLDSKIYQVFITENEINFLAFPQIKDSLVIFGAGYGFEMLRKAQWLSRCRIHYWGDIDTHGFAILDQLRSQFDHVESFLMDHDTLLSFKALWGEEGEQTLRDLPRLNHAERVLYDNLRDNCLGRNVRLEQEKIGFGWVESALVALQQSRQAG